MIQATLAIISIALTIIILLFLRHKPKRVIYSVARASVDSFLQHRIPRKAQHLARETEQAIAILTSVPGMTPAHHRDSKRASTLFAMRDGSLLKTFKNPAGVDHVFIENRKGEIAFGGFVGWIHSEHLRLAITSIRQALSR